MPIQSFPTLLLCDGKERKGEKSEGSIKIKKSNNKSLKPPTRLKKGIKNLIVCFFRLKPKKRK